MTAASQERGQEATAPVRKPRAVITAISRDKMTAEERRAAHEFAIEDMGADW